MHSFDRQLLFTGLVQNSTAYRCIGSENIIVARRMQVYVPFWMGLLLATALIQTQESHPEECYQNHSALLVYIVRD